MIISNQTKMENLINDLDLDESDAVLLNTLFFVEYHFYKKKITFFLRHI